MSVSILISLLVLVLVVFVVFWIIDAAGIPYPINMISKAIVGILAIVAILTHIGLI